MKIIGGYSAYRAACHKAQYESRAHNPCVRYDINKGFYVDSALHGNNDNEIKIGDAAFSAVDGSAHLPGTRAAYRLDRALIVAWIAAVNAGKSHDEIRNILSEIRWNFECGE